MKKSPLEPNISFVGRKDGRLPLTQITNGDSVISLPKDQSKPFFHPEAKTICKLFSTHYKPVKKK